MNESKMQVEPVEVKEATDCFNGTVAIFEDAEKKEDQRFWVEQQRKDNYTDYLTIEDAEVMFQQFLNDTMF